MSISKIIILGSGYSKCKTLESNVRQALQQMDIQAEIDHITDFGMIASYGVMRTPALVIDEKVVSVGKVLSPKEAEKIIQKYIDSEKDTWENAH